MPTRDPTGSVVRNLIALRRVANGLAREQRAAVRGLIDAIVGELAAIDPTAPGRMAYRRRRVTKLMQRLTELTAERYPVIQRALESDLARLGRQQAVWAADTLRSSTGVGSVNVNLAAVNAARFRQIMAAEPFYGELMKDWFKTHRAGTLRRVRQQVQLGMAQDETLGDIVRRIRGTSVGGGRFRGGVMATSTRQAEAIARTAVTFIANKAHTEAYVANADVVRGVEFTATLDARTTPICARWDGTVWPVGDPGIQTPPLHVNCRSVLTPVVDWEGLGIDAPRQGTRASRDGQVPASTTYEQWFRGLSASEQNEIIGRTRAALFRDDRLTFRDMIGKDNRVLSLAEL